MTPDDLFQGLVSAAKVAEVESALDTFEMNHETAAQWVPLGRENNQGTIGASSDPGRSLVERLTNGVDAILESEYALHRGNPSCRTPKEAAIAWLNVPEGGLSEMSEPQRRGLAQRVSIRVGAGEGKEGRVIEIRDRGIGLLPSQMPATILSLNESNKMKKRYLVGVYGQGGSSTFAVSKYTLIASRYQDHPSIGFSVVRFKDVAPEEEEKIGHYVYLTLDGAVLEASLSPEAFPSGTVVKHFGYDLSDYAAKIGPTSVYGLLTQGLFDPVVPVWLDDYEVHDIRRVIKGARNALNGAVDEGDEEKRGPRLAHHVPLFYVTLGEFGRIGIEYWVLEAPTQTNRNPTRAFVNPSKPIILTQNGQSHGELSQLLIKKNADLLYLAQRLICHVDCNSLTPLAKRVLFVTNREDARRGQVLNLIQEELVKALRSDDDLTRLNNEAKELGMRERDEEAEKEMRKEVARLLRIHGMELGASITENANSHEVGPAGPHTLRRPKPTPRPIELHDPPTYVRFVWPKDQDITFYREQRRYVRVETDANSYCHNCQHPAESRINIVRPEGGVVFCGTTPLQGGRMRVILEGDAKAKIGQRGTIRIELARPGLPMLWDERPFVVVETPRVNSIIRPDRGPEYDWREVEGPDSDLWIQLNWPDNVNAVASSATMEGGKLIIYYSAVFPKYATQLDGYQRRDVAQARSFTKRYKIWLAVHSLLLYQDQQTAEAAGAGFMNSAGHRLPREEDPELIETRDCQERCRIATLAAIFAAREVQSPLALAEVD